MRTALAFLILAAVLIAIASLVTMEHRPNGLAMPLLVHAAAPTPRHPVAWRLNSVCTIDEHKNTGHIV